MLSNNVLAHFFSYIKKVKPALTSLRTTHTQNTHHTHHTHIHTCTLTHTHNTHTQTHTWIAFMQAVWSHICNWLRDHQGADELGMQYFRSHSLGSLQYICEVIL